MHRREGVANNPVLILMVGCYGLNAPEEVADNPVLILMVECYGLNAQEGGSC